MTRIKMGFVAGFALGYYLGSAAGRERHEQLKSFIHRVTNSAPASSVSDKAKDVVDSGVHKAKDTVNYKLHRHNKLGETTEFMPS